MTNHLFAIITENDESSWDDITGKQYHFPKRYANYIPPGTKVIYYKGKLRNKEFANQRPTNDPHYFGTAIIEYIRPDEESTKGDYFAYLSNFANFEVPVLINNPNGYYEQIPPNLAGNYWRNAVRPISEVVYNSILNSTNILITEPVDTIEFERDYWEGNKKVRYGTYYERNKNLRKKAIEIHGLSCQACGFNFRKTYGNLGEGFIHVHHTKPLSQTGKCSINPKQDLVVVCPNCHVMLHRAKDKVLTIEELKRILAE